MTVQEAKLMWSTQSLSLATTKGDDRTVSIRETWQVVCDPDDTSEDILDAPSLPRLNQRYAGTLGIIVKSKSPRRISPIFYHVDVEYRGEFGPGGVQDSPLNRPPVKRWGKLESDEPIDEDADGNPIVTANGEPINGVTMKVSDLVLSVRRNYAAVNQYATHQYLHSVNSDSFAGFPPGMARLTGFNAQEVISESIGGYYEVEATIQFRFPYRTTPQRAWWSRNRHEGFKVLDKPGGKIKRAIDTKTKEPSVTPVLLKSNGTQEFNANNANWLEFKRYQPLPYSSLGLL